MPDADPMVVERIRRTWSLLTVPVRPSAEGLAVYESRLPRGARVLVLGVTPELVDLAVRHDARRIVSMERHQPVISAFRQLATEDWGRVELRCADWLEDDPDLHGQFDRIFCDGGLLFLCFAEQWERLLALMRRYLGANGFFIGKMTCLAGNPAEYEARERQMIEQHQRLCREHPDLAREYFIQLVSELRVLTFFGATRPDGSLDQDLMLNRTNRLVSLLLSLFHDPEEVEIIRAGLVYLARSSVDRADTVTGAGIDLARRLFESNGFSFEAIALSDPPPPCGNYMIIAGPA